MITFAISFISGIGAYNFFPFFPVTITVLCIIAAAFLLFPPHSPSIPPLVTGLSLFPEGNTDGAKCGIENCKKAILIFLIFTSGFLYSLVRQKTLPAIEFPDKDISIKGTIIDVPEMSNEKIRFTLDRVYLEGEKIQGKARLVIIERFSGIDVPEYLFAPGDGISAIARLRKPNTFRNPGVYSHNLNRDGIAAVGYIKQIQLTVKGRGEWASIHKKRQMLGRIIDNSLSAENASFLKAIITGLKKSISVEMRDSFGSTGLAHLLSISGTHFGLLAFIIFSFIKMIIRYLPIQLLTRMTLYITPTQIAVLLTLPALALYALISGSSTPTIRSFIMVFIFMLALLLGRKGVWLNSLSIAALIILLRQPGALFELSFQLSFLAVLSIGYVLEKKAAPGEQDHRSSAPPPIKRISNKIKTAMLITVAAVLGTAPLTALYFKQFPLISPITNLIVTPLVCFVILPLSFFTGFSALLFNMSTLPASGLTDIIIGFTLKLVKIFSAFPYSNLHVHNPSFAVIIFYYLSLLSLFKNNGQLQGKLKWRFLPFIFIICLYLIRPFLSGDNLSVTFLDVGQGEASLTELPDKRVMLLDGGMNDPDMGRRVIAPYLWSRGIKSIDYMVLSHPHPDHYGGLVYVMDNFKIGEIWLNGRSTFEAGSFFKKIMEKKIPFRILRRGDVLEAEGYKIYVFHPYDEFYADSSRGEFSNQNSDSLVLKIETHGASILFTGDIETEAEENLVHLGKRLKSDIIKAPHHGGRTSNSIEFIHTVNPEIAVFSTGRNNPFNHPHQQVLERYKNVGTKIIRTDRQGAITISSTGNSYRVTTYRDSKTGKVSDWRDEVKNLKLLF